MVVPYIALVAAFCTALVFAVQHVRRASPVDTEVATGVPNDVLRDERPFSPAGLPNL